jgi:hypothetical protein
MMRKMKALQIFFYKNVDKCLLPAMILAEFANSKSDEEIQYEKLYYDHRQNDGYFQWQFGAAKLFANTQDGHLVSGNPWKPINKRADN